MNRPLLVMASPPTANGDLHLGHLAGPYLGADAFTRYQRMKGKEVFFTTGSDDHQSYVVRKGESLGLDPEATAAMFSERMKQTLHLAAIEPDVFTPSHSSLIYRAFVASFFENLWKQGSLVSKEAAVLYCPSCHRHLFGADVWGACGNCSERCDGALCEGCGHPVSSEGLKDPECGRCNRPAEVRSVQQLIFRLSDFASQLRSYHASPRMRPHSQTCVESMLSEGLSDISVSHPGNWGIPVPVPGFENQCLDVWAEVGPGYLATTQEMTSERGNPDGWQDFWGNKDSEIVQFFGFDNTFAHTVLHPALLMAHGGYRPPDAYVINEFYRLDGTKFSSSRSHAVWGGEILTRVPADMIRYYLCLTSPETRQENFSLSKFQETVNYNLAGLVETTIDHIYSALRSRTPGPNPLPISITETDDTEIPDPLIRIARAAKAMGRSLEAETFSLQKSARIWRDMVAQLGNHWRRIEANQTLVSAQAEWEDALDRAAAALTVIASCAYPLMPQFATRLWTTLGVTHELKTHPWGEPVFLSSNQPFQRGPDNWFTKVTDEQISNPMAEVALG